MLEVRLLQRAVTAWQPGPRITLTRFPCLLGRSRQCDYRLAHPLVSRRHCVLWCQDSRVWIKDLGSRNGTLLNGESLVEPRPLSDGDYLCLALLTFEVQVRPGPECDAPVPWGTSAGCDSTKV
jgi:pSer/pThr/pTyr-binding forkhead associated (FHA) protein